MSAPAFYQHAYAEATDPTAQMTKTALASSELPTSPTSQNPHLVNVTSGPELNLSPETVSNFCTSDNGQLLWFATPPLVLDAPTKPQHSLEYLYQKLRQRKDKKSSKDTGGKKDAHSHQATEDMEIDVA
ncbi:hypothetical protein K493DRAFT_319372 [Basidiobolus meristosporus CBS 931.73]|uniref:Uncharacterized protein n=1 Tax=Basidiobolus meristosporus CBS 931.73 TaxID=1314790 RepID=A0A1Y1XS11_9FUNG|nr:hypothetical protein K493DRAFT_319372 [Basidiobolus meristosporus CBS 931.73]|eukprot:ORX88548.1 hypothetical protein K493DRAFT_319372 [Basidiobolus meristosporus CBS 931.73]